MSDEKSGTDDAAAGWMVPSLLGPFHHQPDPKDAKPAPTEAAPKQISAASEPTAQDP